MHEHIDLEQLTDVVRQNCHIADARHAANYTLCIYLLKMRELYRWEQGYALEQELSGEAVGEWVKQREEYWESLEAKDYSSIPVNGDWLDPFDQAAINQRLLPLGLVYSAGLGRNAAAHFFLGELEETRYQNGSEILISGREMARDLTSPPAMTRESSIFLRRESLRRLLWERVQEWRWDRTDGALGRALSRYDLEDNFDQGLEALVDSQLEVVLWHEVGEVMAGQSIEMPWHVLLLAIAGSRAELMARAVRDNLADVLSTLPNLLEDVRPERLHYYFATLSPMRKQLYPSLITGYQNWLDRGTLDPLIAAVEEGRDHWRLLIDDMIEQHKEQGDDCSKAVVALIDSRQL
ncbi:MAG: hypothetical protein DSZ28_09565 [Thiothrix sp.]|nr:MAG: hypothetical protein DSZ28_09565 [Thiothrix sp.]